MSKKLYEKILSFIPPSLFRQKDSKYECAIDIYLTIQGVRPACIPFDGEVQHGGISSDEMFTKLTKTREGTRILQNMGTLPNITVMIGPYYDVGESIVLVNTKKIPYLLPIMDEIAKLRAENGHKHILMGKMLGYTCPLDLNELAQGDIVYSIVYRIDRRDHMPSWCPLSYKRLWKNASNLLIAMNKALQLIGKKAELIISLEQL